MKELILFLFLAGAAWGQALRQITDYSEHSSPIDSADWLLMHDTSANAYRKISPANLTASRQAANGNLTEVSNLADPGADRILMWDDSATGFRWLIPGTGLSITDDTINSSGGGGLSLTGTRVPYGDGAGGATSEAAFSYDPTFNILSVGAILYGGGTAGIEANGSGIFTFSNVFTTESITLNLGSGSATTAFLTSSSGITLWDFGSIAVSGPLNAYDATSWNGSRKFATEDAVRDKIESMGSGGSVATDAIFDAKGDLAVGTGANTSARLPVGSNGQVLTADSAEATGTKWSTVAGTGDVTAASNFGTDNRLLRSDGTAKGAQSTGITVDDSNNVTGVNSMTVTTLVTTALNAAGFYMIEESGVGVQTIQMYIDSAHTANRTLGWSLADADLILTVPESMTLAGIANTQTLTNKTISGASNTISNINASNLASGTVPTARLGTGTADGTTYLRGDGTWAPAGGGSGGSISANRQNVFLWEEFIGSGAFVAGEHYGQLALINSTGGSGATSAAATGTTTAPGIAITRTGTTTTGYSVFRSVSDGFFFGAGSYTIEGRVKIPVINDGVDDFSVHFGFHDLSGTVAAQDGAYFIYESGSTFWKIATRSNSSGSATATNITAAADTWYKLQVVVNAAANSVAYYIDGTEVNVSPLTANIPTTVNRQTGISFGIVKTAGTNSRDAQIDYAGLEIGLSSSR